MIDILTKPADQLSIDDLQALIDSSVQEDERIEFKRDLPAETGQDPWYDGRKLGKKAKTTILEESVAFVNAFGGTLILGIDEKKFQDGPGVANKISPIPRCADLATRLELVFRDWVEPYIPGLEIIPIKTQDDAGVVIIRVSRSRLAPHRVIPTRVCPIRRSDRCEPMTMREIQDLVLNIARGTEKLDALLTERSERFEEEFRGFSDWNQNAIGIRATAVPVGDEIWFEPSNEALRDELAWHSVIANSGDDLCELDGGSLKIPATTKDWRPILRGAKMGGYPHRPTDTELNVTKKVYREIHCNGLVELGLTSFRSTNLFFEPDRYEGGILPAEWLITIFANLLVWIDRLRNHAGAPVAEYALELETRIYGNPLPSRLTVREGIEIFRIQRGYQYRGEMRTSFDNDPALGTSMDSTRFPRYSLGSSDEIIRILNAFELDLWNNVGLRDQGHDGLTIKDFGQS